MRDGRSLWSVLGKLRGAAGSGGSSLALARNLAHSEGGNGSAGPESMDLWMGRMAEALEEFDAWLVQHEHSEDYWSSFGEFIRGMLNRCVGATRVTPYEITSNGRELLALRDANPLVQTDRLSIRKGIIGHVVTTGRTYVAGDPGHGALVDALARESEAQIEWCFLVEYATQRLGVVTAGKVAVSSAPILEAVEELVGLCWFSAFQTRVIATLQQCDPVCEVLARPAFLEAADLGLSQAYEQGAPAAVAVLSLEGLRAMNDSGRWEVADDLLRDVSKFLRAKVRGEDRLGRFDGTRFVLLLRCVDSELATLIVRQLIAGLGTLVGDFGRWGERGLKVRCGLAGSGTQRPALRELVTRALRESERARRQNRSVCSDTEKPALEECPA